MEGANIIVHVLRRKNRENIVLGLGAKEDGPLASSFILGLAFHGFVVYKLCLLVDYFLFSFY